MSTKRRTEEMVALDREHVIHPMSGYKRSPGVVLEEGQGIRVRDTEGREYLDFIAGLLCVNVGYGRQELAEAAAAQMKKLSYATAFWGFTNPANVECAEKLKELTPAGLDHFLFCSGGSEAIESALKIARLYWQGRGIRKYKIIALHNCYHGLTYGAMSATAYGHKVLSTNFEPLVPGFVHIPWYHCYRCSFGLTYPECDTACARFLEETIVNEGEGTVAAFLAEPVQGSGGMIPSPPTYWPLVRQICSEHKVLLIADEVMTGFGRTGQLFAVNHWGVRPDIMTMAKGITSGYVPLAAVALSDAVFQGLTEGAPFFIHGFTYTGHPVGSAVAVKNMEIIVREKLWENAARQGQYLLRRLSEFLEFEHVGNVGGLGLMVGLELVADKSTRTKLDPARGVGAEVVRQARQNGVLIREFADRIGFGPPLTVTSQDIDQVVDILRPIIAGIKAP